MTSPWRICLVLLILTSVLALSAASGVNAQVPDPLPSFFHDPILIAINRAEIAYCKKAASLACSLYMGHAGGCATVAYDAERIYGLVLMWKQQGLSSHQAIEQSGGSDVAQAAVEMIDGMTMKEAANPKWPEIFARTAILPECLDRGK